MDKDVKYSYVNDITHLFEQASEKSESELIIHPGHVIKLTNAKYKTNSLGHKYLEIDAIIQPTQTPPAIA